jgi:hypothetical protein
MWRRCGLSPPRFGYDASYETPPVAGDRHADNVRAGIARGRWLVVVYLAGTHRSEVYDADSRRTMGGG